MPSQAEEIRRFLLRNIPQHSRDIARFTADAFGVTRQTISYHLRKLQKEGLVVAKGRTSARQYSLKEETILNAYPLSDDLEEHVVWREFVAPLLADVPAPARGICNHGITEMVNNAREHSEGTEVIIGVTRTPLEVTLTVMDDGIGAFRKIQEALGFSSPRDAVLELTKGKLTTDPQRHTGEGIFFTSRMFDEFALTANGLVLIHRAERGDWFIEGQLPADDEGTGVRMNIDVETARTTTSVFDQFSSPDDDGAAFDVTHVPVALAAYGEESLISRSQARRVLARCTLFRRVVLDFQGVTHVGRAFADEMFRVFPQEHPEIHLRPVNASPEIERTIRRVAQETEQLDLLGMS